MTGSARLVIRQPSSGFWMLLRELHRSQAFQRRHVLAIDNDSRIRRERSRWQRVLSAIDKFSMDVRTLVLSPDDTFNSEVYSPQQLPCTHPCIVAQKPR
jgi:hypothetical protein